MRRMLDLGRRTLLLGADGEAVGSYAPMKARASLPLDTTCPNCDTAIPWDGSQHLAGIYLTDSHIPDLGESWPNGNPEEDDFPGYLGIARALFDAIHGLFHNDDDPVGVLVKVGTCTDSTGVGHEWTISYLGETNGCADLYLNE